MRAVGLQDERRDKGPLTTLKVAELFSKDVRSRDGYGVTLFDVIDADPVVSISELLGDGDRQVVAALGRLQSLRLL